MTACWSRGSGGRYPYYKCFARSCPEYRKSIRRERMEVEFHALLGEIKPSETPFRLAYNAFRELWDRRLATTTEHGNAMKAELTETARKIDQPLDRIVETDGRTLITAYEARLKALEARKLELGEKIANSGRPMLGFEESFRTAMDFLGNRRSSGLPSDWRTSEPSSNWSLPSPSPMRGTKDFEPQI
jgi:site-specific DNA recombinase